MTPLLFPYPISVGILYLATRGPDGDDTRETVGAITDALESRGHMVKVVEVRKNNWRSKLSVPGDVVFNLVEDESWDLYRKVALKLSHMGRAVVGMDEFALPFSTDKLRVTKALTRGRVTVPKSRVFSHLSEIPDLRSLNYPLIVKPSGEHSSWGISQDSVVIDINELRQQAEQVKRTYSGSVLVEEYIDGREFHATVIGNGKHLAVLPVVEIDFAGEFADNWNVYTYDAKWEERSWEYWDSNEVVRTRLPKKLDEDIQKLVKKAFNAVKCKDIARFDIRVDAKNKPYIVDVNMCPGLNPIKQSPSVKSAFALGWKYDELIETLVAITYTRKFGRLPDRLRARNLMLGMPRMLG